MSETKPINPLHYRYIILILAIVIISLLTFRYTADTALNNYVSFAATLASLILAILAIIQGFLSSDSFSSSINNLNNTSDEVVQNSRLLNKIMEDFDAKFKDVPAYLENLDANYSKLSSLSKMPIGEEKIVGFVTEDQIKEIFESSSGFGKLLFWISFLSAKNQTSFDIKKLFDNESDSEYAAGYLSALSTFGLFSYEIKDNIYTVSNLSPYVNEWTIRGIERLLEENKTNASYDLMRQTIANIKAILEPAT